MNCAPTGTSVGAQFIAPAKGGGPAFWRASVTAPRLAATIMRRRRPERASWTGIVGRQSHRPVSTGRARRSHDVPRMTGKRALLEQLIADGTTRIFGNPGT